LRRRIPLQYKGPVPYHAQPRSAGGDTAWDSMAQVSKLDQPAQDASVHLATAAALRLSLPAWAVAIIVPLLSVGAITALGFAVSDLIALKSIPMLYLAAVVVSALARGRVSALLAASLSFLAYDFFFIEPRWTFSVAYPDEVVALFMFVGVALVTGTLAARLSEQVGAARDQARSTIALFEFSRKLSTSLSLDAVLTMIVGHIGQSLGAQTVVLVEDESGTLAIAASEPPGQSLTLEAVFAARAAREKRVVTGVSTEILPEAGYTFFPILSAQRVVAVFGMRQPLPDELLPPQQNSILVSMLEQAAIAIDRAQWARESARAAVSRESERLQSALLSSLSHDFRTPLASITGAATSLRQLGDKMDASTRDDLLESIAEDAGQLNRFVANLFDMTRIESGALKVKREDLDLPEILERAVARVKAIDPAFTVSMSFAPNLPAAQGDAVLLEQVLFNLLDNARKYAGSDQSVAIFVRAEKGRVSLAVTDQGKGIAVADLERIFDKFYRRGGGDGRAAGTGLGLSIARGFVAAMGGTIGAESPATRKHGTRFLIRLPIAPGDAS
jgi:two-component system sensor histidine kinase KdpD